MLSPFPFSEAILCYFASYLACQHLSPQTIKTYLAGIRHTQITLGLPEPRQFSSLPRLRLVQSGIQRSYSQHSPAPSLIRLPIIPAILRQIHQQWARRASEYDIVMLWAAAVVCFFGFFRSGEITVPSVSAYDESVHLSWGDIAIDNPQSPTIMIRVKLKKSKTDQLGKGADIMIGRTDCVLCPVTAVLSYMMLRGSSQGPFFRCNDGQPLTKAKFIHHVREALQTARLPYSSFAGHSFRIGAATTAARVGVEDSTIRMLGRWSSGAFLSYIRLLHNHIAHFSRSLANS